MEGSLESICGTGFRVRDGLGTTHTNPAYPRDKPRTLWFFIIPGKSAEVEAYTA